MPLPFGVKLDRLVSRTTTEEVTREVATAGRVVALNDYVDDWELFSLNQFSTYQQIAAQSENVEDWAGGVRRLVVEGDNLPGPAEVSIGDVLEIVVTGWGSMRLTVSSAQNAGGHVQSQYEISAFEVVEGDQNVPLPDPAPGSITYPASVQQVTEDVTTTRRYWAGRRDFSARDSVQVGTNVGIFTEGDSRFFIRGTDGAAFPIAEQAGVGVFHDPLANESWQVKGISRIDRGRFLELLCRSV